MLTTILICVYFYMTGMRQSVYMVRTSAGIYQPDKYLALLEAVINIGLAIALVIPLGINGVLIANLVSLMAIPFWTQPYIAYRKVFERGLGFHYRRYAFYAVILVGSAGLTYLLCSLLPISNPYLRLLANAVLAVIVPNGVNILIFRKTTEFQYLKGMGLGLVHTIAKRAKKKAD